MTSGTKSRAATIAAALLCVVLASPGGAAADSCRREAGERAADRYVEDCLAVSAATRPPCNASNSCALILGEIERSCAQIAEGDDGSRVCRRYR